MRLIVGCAQKICSLLLNRSKIHEFTSAINCPRRAFVNHDNIASWWWNWKLYPSRQLNEIQPPNLKSTWWPPRSCSITQHLQSTLSFQMSERTRQQTPVLPWILQYSPSWTAPLPLSQQPPPHKTSLPRFVGYWFVGFGSIFLPFSQHHNLIIIISHHFHLSTSTTTTYIHPTPPQLIAHHKQ